MSKARKVSKKDPDSRATKSSPYSKHSRPFNRLLEPHELALKPTIALDHLDNGILLALRANGRMQNKSMSKLLGVTELTIAARLKRLTKNGVTRATAQWDFASLGYAELIWIEILVKDRPVADVASELGAWEDSIVVLGLVGEPQLRILVASRNVAHRQQIFHAIAKIRGIQKTEVVICLDILKWRADYVFFL